MVALNLVPIVVLALLTGAFMAVFLRLTGFLLVLGALLTAASGLWFAGQAPSPMQFIAALVSLQAGYLGGVIVVAGQSRAASRQSHPVQDRASKRPTHAELK